MSRKLRLGIDVGGTFTDVVAIDAQTRAVVSRVKVPTTHTSPDGVATGIVTGISTLLEMAAVDASDVVFIAHSTTQATNALLEGDVARVGVVGLLGRIDWLARAQMRFSPVPLAPGIALTPAFAYAPARDLLAIAASVDALIDSGAQAIVATQAFGVDRPGAEEYAVDHARSRGVFATAGHDITAMYGLRARTRTAALNAAILPKMVHTARMTARAVRSASIGAPLMIMRSDGGVMEVGEIERRPIQTLLSGPAAGVAGALLHESVSDGIFIEVGGTSSDCTAIRAGQPRMRPARIGGHRTMLRTVDVRTLGVAGGSMVRISENGIAGLGPRSAHIAGCAYACFLDPASFAGARIETIAPKPSDTPDYAAIVFQDGTRAALTPTCASNLLGYIPDGDFASGNREAARRGFALLAERIGGTADTVARRVLEYAAQSVSACIVELIADNDLDRTNLVLVGGGGGAAAIVPFVAESMSVSHRIARDAEVISPIGVALALVRDVVERTIVDPSAEDIARIRREASDRAIAAGASPDRIEVSIEIDAQRSRVRATASGATALAESAAHGILDEPGCREAAARSLRCAPELLERVELSAVLRGYRHGSDLRIVDERGVTRLALRNAAVTGFAIAELDECLLQALERATSFGDVGRSLPELYLVHGGRIADFSGLTSVDQALALAREETAGRTGEERVAALSVTRLA
ncbi:MAG: hydantoinase/oxoprolinase family protein [Vulcanimicrobiaceae bacterium]